MNKNKFNKIILYLLLFFSWAGLVISLWGFPRLLTMVIILLTLIYFLFFKQKGDYQWYLVTAILGPIGEIWAVASGLWEYNTETILGVPYWLPLAWGITALVFRKALKLYES
jgi:hypothetical protein